MTERLYYHDAYTTEFQATVLEQIEEDGRYAITLDKTHFYPTSGGQPHDIGKVNNIPVTNVTVSQENGRVLHWLADKLEKTQVSGQVEWTRRFDHMQHHTGQHILSQAFIQICDAHTVGFHLSQDSVTIDLDNNTLSQNHIAKAEQLSNNIIWENRPVSIQMATIEDAKSLKVRKIPPAQTGKLRLVNIGDFDLTACGGTHVAQTGAVGLVKIIKTEKRGEKLRVEFRCGNRASQDYGQKNNIIAELNATLTTSSTKLSASITKLQQELKDAGRKLKKQQNELMAFEAESLMANGRIHHTTTIITKVLTDSDPKMLRTLANQLTQKGEVIVLLGLAGQKSQLLFGRSDDAPGQMNHLLKATLAQLGSKSGGGTEQMAQGGGLNVTPEALQNALDFAERQILSSR